MVVDDEPEICRCLRTFLEAHGYDVETAGDCATGEQRFRCFLPDVVVLDYELPDGNALELIPRLRQLASDVSILILTGHASIELAVETIKAGAEQFLTKPLGFSTLLVMLGRAIENQRARQELSAGRRLRARLLLDPFLGASPAIRALADEAHRILQTESPVLILGETGVGKGVLASWLHHNGTRARETFVDLNCAGISRELLDSELFGHERGAFTGAAARKPGLLKVAHRGTVFLDEVGDMDLAVQAQLLKVIEEKRFRRVGDVVPRQVDIRLIAATHQDLPALVQQRRFREDLYYRLNVLPLRIPPLRERVEDIVPTARYLLNSLGHELGRGEARLAPDAEAALRSCYWRGNVRELRNVLERALLRCGGSELRRECLSIDRDGALPACSAVPGAALTLQNVVREHIERVLAEEGGRVEEAARRLGVPRSTLYKRLRGLRPGPV